MLDRETKVTQAKSCLCTQLPDLTQDYSCFQSDSEVHHLQAAFGLQQLWLCISSPGKSGMIITIIHGHQNPIY